MRISGVRIPLPHTLRRSITDYYPGQSGYFNAFPNNSTSHLPGISPPLYEDSPTTKASRTARLKVDPREEEGREDLPSYSCSITKENVFQRKMEMRTPFERADDRSWHRVYVILRGTMLSVHSVKNAGFFSKVSITDASPDKPAGTTPGSLIKQYTLQHAEVGIAADYKKYDASILFSKFRMLTEIADDILSFE